MEVGHYAPDDMQNYVSEEGVLCTLLDLTGGMTFASVSSKINGIQQSIAEACSFPKILGV